MIGGTAVGPSPVFSHTVPPGKHRVILKRKGADKTIMVNVTAGQLTTHTVSMK